MYVVLFNFYAFFCREHLGTPEARVRFVCRLGALIACPTLSRDMVMNSSVGQMYFYPATRSGELRCTLHPQGVENTMFARDPIPVPRRTGHAPLADRSPSSSDKRRTKTINALAFSVTKSLLSLPEFHFHMRTFTKCRFTVWHETCYKSIQKVSTGRPDEFHFPT